jgi:hypothetical protein
MSARKSLLLTPRFSGVISGSLELKTVLTVLTRFQLDPNTATIGETVKTVMILGGHAITPLKRAKAGC